MELFPRRLVLGVVFVVLLLVLGVLGFVFLEHESLLNALLMTVLTISTASYSPNHPFDATGKVLVIILIAGGLVGLALAISAMTEYFMGGQLRSAWDRRRMDRAIERLNGHFIISGYGRVGREVARQFAEMDVPFVVVDINPEVIVRARDAGYLYMEADAADAESLAAAGLSRARGLVACADSDMNNVYVTLSARSANPDVFIVARAAYADASSKLYNAGANRVVSPYVMAGRQMAELAARPLVADYLNLLFDGKQIDV
ncbi:MAG: potassium channel family protein, partial [Chloroflexota bacterium]